MVSILTSAGWMILEISLFGEKKSYCKLITEEYLVNRDCALLLSTTQINLISYKLWVPSQYTSRENSTLLATPHNGHKVVCFKSNHTNSSDKWISMIVCGLGHGPSIHDSEDIIICYVFSVLQQLYKTQLMSTRWKSKTSWFPCCGLC